MITPTSGKLKPLAKCRKPVNIKCDNHKFKHVAYPIPDHDPNSPKYLCVMITYYKNKIADVGIFQGIPELTPEEAADAERIQKAVDDAMKSLEALGPMKVNYSEIDSAE